MHDWQIKELASLEGSQYRGIVERAYSGKGARARNNAIHAMCLQCVGYLRLEVTNCTGWACPLHRYRPYQQPAKPKKREAADKVI